MFELDHLLLHRDERSVDLLLHHAKIGNHSLKIRHHLSLGLLEEDAIDETPALPVVFKLANLLQYESNGYR